MASVSLQVESCVAQHIGDREEQEDRVVLLPHPRLPGTLLAVVADGMGGFSGGGIASDQVVHKAREALDTFAPVSETPQQALRAMMDEAHIIINLASYTSQTHPHSTAAALLLQPGRADWAHCGDSRIYHFRGATLMSRTRDHSMVAQLVEMGALREDQALAHPQRSMLYTCLGGDREPQVDFGAAEPLQAQDAFVLCSDGLWTYFSEFELGSILAAHPPRVAAEMLMERARGRARGGGDNVSLVILKLTELPAEPVPARPTATTPTVAAPSAAAAQKPLTGRLTPPGVARRR